MLSADVLATLLVLTAEPSVAMSFLSFLPDLDIITARLDSIAQRCDEKCRVQIGK